LNINAVQGKGSWWRWRSIYAEKEKERQTERETNRKKDSRKKIKGFEL